MHLVVLPTPGCSNAAALVNSNIVRQALNRVEDKEPTMAVAGSRTSEWTLWVVAFSCAAHAIDEYVSGWQAWAHSTFEINMPTALFALANTILVVVAAILARSGWRRPTASLVIPAATLVNAVFMHIVPAVVQRRVVPGLVTAALLYVPFSTWAFVGAWRSRVQPRAMVAAGLAGTGMMVGFATSVRYLMP